MVYRSAIQTCNEDTQLRCAMKICNNDMKDILQSTYVVNVCNTGYAIKIGNTDMICRYEITMQGYHNKDIQ